MAVVGRESPDDSTEDRVSKRELGVLGEDIEFHDLRAEGLDDEFESLDAEDERVYQFDNHVLTITDPVALRECDDGSHEILDSRGVSYSIYPKWNYIAWKTADGEPHFTE